jgi:hypothetical protein
MVFIPTNPPSLSGWRLMLNKAFVVQFVFPTFLVAQVFAVDSPGDEAATRRGFHEFAASQIARQVVGDFDAEQVSNASERLQQEILRDTTGHQKRAESTAKLLDFYGNLLMDRFLEKVRMVAANLNASIEEPEQVNESWLLEYAQDRYRGEIGAAIRKNSDTFFQGYFDRARNAAVESQKKRIQRQFAPEQQEVESLAQQGWSQEAVQIQKSVMLERVSGDLGQPLLEETEDDVGRLIDETIQDARSQWQAQLAVVQGFQPPLEFIEAEQIEGALQARLNSLADSIKNTPGSRKVYEVFSDIAEKVPLRAAEIEKERFETFIKGDRNLTDRFPLAELIRSDLAAHKKPDKSLHLATNAFREQFGDRCMEAYAKRTSNHELRDRFQKRLEGYLQDDSAIRAALIATLREILSPSLNQARLEISQWQLKEHFPRVVSNEWTPQEDFIAEKAQSRSKGLWISREPIVKDVDPNLPGVTEGGAPYDSNELLLETERDLSGRLGKLIQEGVAVWDAQQGTLQMLEPAIRSDIGKDPGRMALPEWISHYENLLSEKWSTRRTAVLESHWNGPVEGSTKKYDRLFGRVKERVRQVVKDQFEVAIAPPTATPPVPRPTPVPTAPPAVRKQIQNTPSTAPNLAASSAKGTQDGGAGDGDTEGKKKRGGLDGDLLGTLRKGSTLLWWLLLLLLILLILLLLLLILRWLFRGPSEKRTPEPILSPRILVTLFVKDLSASDRFYSAIGGVQRVRQIRGSVFLAIGDAFLELNQRGGRGHPPEPLEIRFLDEEIDRMKKGLMDLNLQPDSRGFFTDPDGNLVGFEKAQAVFR